MIDFTPLEVGKSDKNRGITIRIYEYIRESILNEHYPDGARLPAVRKAAAQFGVNPATIMKAYNRLESEGLIEKRGGSGCSVSYDPTNQMSVGDDEMERPELIAPDSNIINFASGSLSSELFPVERFKECLNAVLDRDGGEAFHYQDAQGYQPLRARVSRLLQDEGMPVREDSMQIVSGSQQAIDLIVRTLVREGDLIMMENPGYPGAISAFRKAGARIASLPVDSDGFSLKAVEAHARTGAVRLLYTSSTFQNPSGVTLSDYKKRELVKLAQKYDFLIIEDDCLSDLYYGAMKPKLIKSFDSDDRVIYIKSYSKIFMPGLRLGLMTIPEGLRQQFIAAKYSTDISNSGLNQRAFELYLQRGYHKDHSEMIQKKMGARFEMMKSRIASMKNCSLCFEPDGGLYFWMKLNREFDSRVLCNRNSMVRILPGRNMSPDRKTASFFRLSFAAVPLARITEGLARLDELAGRR